MSDDLPKPSIFDDETYLEYTKGVPPPLEIKEMSKPLSRKLPQLKREVSSNFTIQRTGDCYAHSIARPLLMEFRRLYPDDLNIETDDSKECMELYENPTIFFNEQTHTHTIDDLDLIQCRNPKELLNIILYMFFWSTLASTMGGDGAALMCSAMFLLYKVIYDYGKNINGTKFIVENIMKYCVWQKDSKMYTILEDFFKKIVIDKILFIESNMYFNNHNSSIEPTFTVEYTRMTNDTLHIWDESLPEPCAPSQLITVLALAGTYKNPNAHFFNMIKMVIDQGKYVTLGLPGAITEFLLIKQHLKIQHRQVSKSIYDEIRAQRPVGAPPVGGHGVTIVNYDYSDPKNKFLVIKNTWGEIEETELKIFGFSFGYSRKSKLTYLYESEINMFGTYSVDGALVSMQKSSTILWYKLYNLDEGLLKLKNFILDMILTPELSIALPSNDPFKIFKHHSHFPMKVYKGLEVPSTDIIYDQIPGPKPLYDLHRDNRLRVKKKMDNELIQSLVAGKRYKRTKYISRKKRRTRRK